MKRIASPSLMQKIILQQKQKGKTVALVPTMGFLHAGHLQLVKLAAKKADVVVVSIFVNPLQFGKNEDLKTYPRDLKSDLKKLRALSVDYVFVPSVAQMYGENFQTTVRVDALSQALCGLSRPGHFDGVATVVLKLLHVVNPDVAVFGKKDYQQYLIIKRLVMDLNLPTRIVAAPLLRERDGLAMSSRNVRLSSAQRVQALSVSRALFRVRDLAKVNSRRSLQAFADLIHDEIKKNPDLKIDYVTLCHAETLATLKSYIPRKTLVALAVWAGSVRLIDNVVI